MTKKVTTKEFIEKAKAIHCDRYEYSLVEYVNNHTKIKIICVKHGIFEQLPNDLLNNKCGCKICTKINRAKTNVDRYGTQNPQQNNVIREKTKQTNIKKFGVAYPTQNKKIQEKVKKTNLERHGVENPAQSKEIYDKIKQTNLEKYGKEYPLQNIEIKKKSKITNLKRYGVENPAQSKEIYDKIKQTNLEKYGVDFQIQKNIIDAIDFLDDEMWLANKYKTSSTTHIANLLNVSETTVLNYLNKHNIETKQLLGFSKKAINWLEAIMEQENIFIQHARNIGEYRIPGTRYSVDGYCQETNTVYEFHGDIFHGNPDLFEDHETPNFYNAKLTAKELYMKTKDRENKIIELGYNLAIMWENDYKLYSESISLVSGINS